MVGAVLVWAAMASAATPEALYEYEVVVQEGATELAVEARISAPAAGCFEIGEGLEGYVVAAEARTGRKWRPIPRTNRCFDAPGARPLAIRYRFALTQAVAATAGGDRRRRRLYEEGGGFSVPPTAWLLRPAAFARGRYRLRVRTPPGLHFVTGLTRVAADTYEGRIEFMDGLPYAVITPHAPSTLRVGGGEIEWVRMPGELPVPEPAVARWIEGAAAAVSAYLGAFPVPRVAVIVSGRGGGSTMGFGGASIRVGVSPRAGDGTDWILVHEMVHLALPNLGPEERWLEEGLATYVEPIARLRAGELGASEVWGGFARYMPQGLPAPEGDATAAGERRRRWGRTYWGGALYWLLADVSLLEKTRGRVGLDDVLAAVRRAGGDIRVRWEVEELFATAERAAGVDVLRDPHARDAPLSGAQELDALWSRLGVRLTEHGTDLDDSAPLAWVRRRIGGDRAATP